MRKRISADRGSAITLTAILQNFQKSSNHSLATLNRLCNEAGLGTQKQVHAIMDCLKDMGYVVNHGRNGNKCRFASDFKTSHLMTMLYQRGVIV